MNKPRHHRPVVECGFVACRVGATVYALPIDHVQEIILPVDLTELPDAPPGVIGAVDHRGEVVPVLDVGLRFGGDVTKGSRRKWVLVRAFGRTLGLVFDQVHEVFRVPETEIRPAPEVGDIAARRANEVIAFGDALAFVLDTDALAALAEMHVLEGTVS